ncbi:hypothetical protein AB0F16_20475 [Streptomyces tanashiensis]|uniref:hypothetical protein n=1 Tax=Streptomyces tanashiensis TaxID=67367 RepID=UPI0033FA26CE
MNPTPLPDHDPSPSDPGESEARAVFARVALDVTPGPVPLAAVRRAGRARRRRRAAGLSVLGAAAAVAAVVTLVPVRASSPAPEPVAAPPTAVRTSVPAVSPTVAPIRIRTVRPGERVDAGQGHLVWLTEDGKHWADTDGLENFRSVSDGNIDLVLLPVVDGPWKPSPEVVSTMIRCRGAPPQSSKVVPSVDLRI